MTKLRKTTITHKPWIPSLDGTSYTKHWALKNGPKHKQNKNKIKTSRGNMKTSITITNPKAQLQHLRSISAKARNQNLDSRLRGNRLLNRRRWIPAKKEMYHENTTNYFRHQDVSWLLALWKLRS